jgi:hypothetical protein
MMADPMMTTAKMQNITKFAIFLYLFRFGVEFADCQVCTAIDESRK